MRLDNLLSESSETLRINRKKMAFSLLLLTSLAPMLSSFTIVNAQMTTVTNLMTTSTTYVITSVSYWVMTDSSAYGLYVGSFNVPASPSGLCSVQFIGPFPTSSGDIVSVVGTNDSAINFGLATKNEVDDFQTYSNGMGACWALNYEMSTNFGIGQVQGGRFSWVWNVTDAGSYYFVFYNDLPSAVNVSVHLSLTRLTVFTNTVSETSTVSMTVTSTQTEVGPTLIYLIKDNMQLIVAAVLLCLVACTVGIRRRTRRKKPEYMTQLLSDNRGLGLP